VAGPLRPGGAFGQLEYPTPPLSVLPDAAYNAAEKVAALIIKAGCLVPAPVAAGGAAPGCDDRP
jgi:hypothetical protein